MGALGGSQNWRDGNLQLKQKQFVICERDAVHIHRGDFAVGSRREDDAVLPIGIHYDHSCARRSIIALDMAKIHTILLEIVEQKIAEIIFSYTSKHGNLCAVSGGSNCLIGSLAAWDDLQIFAANGFTRLRKSRCSDDEIGIERTYNEDIRHVQILLQMKNGSVI